MVFNDFTRASKVRVFKFELLYREELLVLSNAMSMGLYKFIENLSFHVFVILVLCACSSMQVSFFKSFFLMFFPNTFLKNVARLLLWH